MSLRDRFIQYAYLMRAHKPVGIFLLLWPTLWALWLDKRGLPDVKTLTIFILGTFLMRSAGCVINDFADRKFDGHVARTKLRPLVTGKVSSKEALILAGVLSLLAFVLVLFCNKFTIYLALIGAVLAFVYPFLKRITHLPQLGLSLAFAWGVPMAFAAELNFIPASAWVLYVTALIWPMMYDTIYAMVDREDDVKIGVKSTAILFGTYDKILIASLQIIFMMMLVMLGFIFHLRQIYFLSLFIVSAFFLYQQCLIKDRSREKCLDAFTNNHWVGLIIFLGIGLGL